MYTLIGQWNYANTGEILQLDRYREHHLRICEKANGIMPVLGEFFKLLYIEGITYAYMDRQVELCQYGENSSIG